MKKVLISAILALGLVSAVQASVTETQNGSYVGVSVTAFTQDDSKVLGVQPIEELIGEGSTQLELKVGMVAYRGDNSDKAKMFMYVWNVPDKNNEVGFGLGGEYVFKPLDSVKNLQFSIGAQIGYGWQGVSGETTNISTSANKLSYVTNTINSAPTTINYTGDTYVLDINLLIGATYHISKDLDLEVGYVYKNSEYQVEYRTAEDSNILNALTFDQDSHGLKVGLNYKF